jgi:hypothetical protein
MLGKFSSVYFRLWHVCSIYSWLYNGISGNVSLSQVK